MRLLHIKIAIVIAIVWYVLTWNYVYDVINWLDDRVRTDALMSNTSMVHTAVFPESNLRLFLFTGVYVFPTYFLISLLLPYVCNRIQSQRHHLGLAYGLNTIAFCLGIIGFTLIAPRISIFYSLKLSIALLVIGSAFLLLVRETQHIDLWKPIVAFCFFVVACFIIPSGFDKAYVNPRGAPANYPVSAMKSNGANTTFVVQFPDHRRIFFGNLSMSGTLPAGQTYMRLMAHVPLLLQANPTKALLICFGVGNTAAAIAAHDSIKQIDAVDLNHQVFQTAPEFSDTHGNVHLDPRIRLINDDGRGYLNLTTEKYDLITSEPPPPMAAGVYRLYSKEYYENVLDRMTPEGMMSQWLPIYQMPAEAVGMAIKTFTTVFPHTLLIVGHTSELILVGARNPFDMNLISERFESSEKLTADLRGIRIYDPNDIFVRAIQTDSDLRLNYANYTVISDERNSLEHLFFSPKTIAKVDYTPKNILAWYEDTAPDILPGLVPIITHLGRVRYRVPGFPFSSLKTDDSVRLADLDWNKMNRLERDATKLIRAGQPARAVSRLLAALEEEPEQPWILVGLIQLYFKYQHLDQTRVHAEKLLQVEPDSPTGLLALGTVQLSQGDSRAAVVKLEKYLEVVPDSPFALNNVAWIRATHPDPRMRNPQIALQYAQRASKLTPDSPESLNTMAAAYASANQFEDAIVTALKAIELAREAGKDALAATTYDHLQLYQREQGVTDHALTAGDELALQRKE